MYLIDGCLILKSDLIIHKYTVFSRESHEELEWFTTYDMLFFNVKKVIEKKKKNQRPSQKEITIKSFIMLGQ